MVWRPKATQHENIVRGIRNLRNGSMDGRILNVSPVRRVRDVGEDLGLDPDEFLEEEFLYPFTDYFTYKKNVHTYDLTYVPYFQEEMEEKDAYKSSVHIYWNNIFQRDLSFSLRGNRLIINDEKKKLREGDSISVKYFYTETEDGNTEVITPEGKVQKTIREDLYCWVSDSPQGNWYWGGGTLSAPSVGSNKGTWKTQYSVYASMSWLTIGAGSIKYKVGLPIGYKNTLPSNYTIISSKVLVDGNRSGLRLTDNNEVLVNNGVQMGTGPQTLNCGIGKTWGSDPVWEVSLPAHTPMPLDPNQRFGTITPGVQEIYRDNESKRNSFVKTVIEGGTRDFTYLPNGYGLGGGGNPCACEVFGFICWDDTVWGFEARHTNNFEVYLGCSVEFTIEYDPDEEV